MNKLYALFVKYKEVILYLVFGGLTTLVNFAGYLLLTRLFGMDTLLANGIALTASILFAYVTNKIFVFESKTKSFGEAFREFVSFIACRIGTAVLDMFLMYVTVELLQWNDIAMKLLVNVVVIVLNYVFSKLLIFKDKRSVH